MTIPRCSECQYFDSADSIPRCHRYAPRMLPPPHHPMHLVEFPRVKPTTFAENGSRRKPEERGSENHQKIAISGLC